MKLCQEPKLLPAVAQNCVTGRVLVASVASADAVRQALATGVATFYSRSRQGVRAKGQDSGRFLAVHAVVLDCNARSVIYFVEPRAVAASVNALTCYVRDHVCREGAEVNGPMLLARLERLLVEPERPLAPPRQEGAFMEQSSSDENSLTPY